MNSIESGRLALQKLKVKLNLNHAWIQKSTVDLTSVQLQALIAKNSKAD